MERAGHAWLGLWLRHQGVEAPAPLVRVALARVHRFPGPVARAWDGLASVADHVGPPLLLHTLRRASRLGDAEFEALERALQSHPSALVRAAHLLLRAPALEALYQDRAPAHAPHPLRALEERIRQGASLDRTHFDVVVVGSGAGGAPLAWRLARAGWSVAVVEAGGLFEAMGANQAIEQAYLDQAMVAGVKGGGSVMVMAGRALGGTTAINSGTSLRPLPERLAAWDAVLGTRFAQGALDPWLAEAEERVGVTTGPRERLDASATVVERGLAALGRDGAFVLPRNAPECTGEGRCCFGCPAGAKLSTDRSFLPGAVEAGAVLLANTTATGVREEPDGVEVMVRTPLGPRRLRARHLVLAAGALSTPLILRHDRLGPRWRQAGRGLRVHPATKVFGLMPEPLPHGGVPQGLGYHAPELPRVTFEGVHTPPGATAPILPAAGHRHRWWMERHDRLASYGMMVRDRSTGAIRGSWPLRRIDYGLHPADARDLGAGVLLVAEVLFAAGAERVLLPVVGLDEGVDADGLRHLRPEHFTPDRLLTSGFHPQGTAGMGRLVDTELGLTERISVCDASVLPDSPGVNPQITLFALSLRLADHLDARLKEV